MIYKEFTLLETQKHYTLNVLPLPVLTVKTEIVKIRKNKYRKGGWETIAISSCLHVA